MCHRDLPTVARDTTEMHLFPQTKLSSAFDLLGIVAIVPPHDETVDIVNNFALYHAIVPAAIACEHHLVSP
jgi:hypothetical protein